MQEERSAISEAQRQALDQLLARQPTPTVSPALRARVSLALERERQRTVTPGLRGLFHDWRLVGSLTAAGVVGAAAALPVGLELAQRQYEVMALAELQAIEGLMIAEPAYEERR